MKIPSEVIFSVLRTLKAVNPGDLYYENYMIHYNKYSEKFYDIYHFSWEWVIEHKPKTILEIGVRTGLSICQLLSAYIDHSHIEKIVLCDLFNDGFISPGLVTLNIKTLGIPEAVISKVEFLKGDSKAIIPDYRQAHLDEKFDYILVDGSHTEIDAKVDLENVAPLVNIGGVLVFDDIGPDGMNLKGVWDQFKLLHSNEFTFNENYNGKGIGTAVRL